MIINILYRIIHDDTMVYHDTFLISEHVQRRRPKAAPRWAARWPSIFDGARPGPSPRNSAGTSVDPMGRSMDESLSSLMKQYETIII